MILIIGESRDPHIEKVCSQINKNDVIVLNPYRDEDSFSFSFNPFRIHFHSERTLYAQEEIRAVWYRVKPDLISYPQSIKEMEIKNFRGREWFACINLLEYHLQNAIWVNPRKNKHLFNSKPHQLLIASENGLIIPDTLISNDPDEILNHFNGKDKIIFKALSYFIFPPNEVLYTNIFTKEYIDNHRPEVRQAPGIYQEIIEKKYELRITVVGDRIFTAKIDSQSNDAAKDDWRKDQLNLEYSRSEIPDELKNKILEINSELDLVYGVYDFIVTPENNYVFLEVNSAGQWLWIEEMIDYPVSEAISQYLIKANSR